MNTPWGPVESPMQILPYFDCSHCGEVYNPQKCPHGNERTPPRWIRTYEAWKRGETNGVRKSWLKKFKWLKLHANISLTNPGFETNDYTGWTTATGGGGTLSIVSAVKNEGTYSSRLAATATNSYGQVYQSLGTQSLVYARCYWRIDTALSGNSKLVKFMRFSGSAGWLCVVGYCTDATGVIGIKFERSKPSYSATIVTTAPNIVVDTWHCIELYCKIHATTGAYGFWLDGTQKVNQTNLNTSGGTDITTLNVQSDTTVAHSSTSWNCWVDSVVADDASQVGCISAVVDRPRPSGLALSGNPMVY